MIPTDEQDSIEKKIFSRLTTPMSRTPFHEREVRHSMLGSWLSRSPSSPHVIDAATAVFYPAVD
jgi:hypothetical protein